MPENQADRVAPPSMLLALTEPMRALFELGSMPMAAPLLAMAPRGDGHPVLVLPGFITSDRSTGLLRRFLTRMGYDAYTWNLGRNLGPKAIGDEGEHLIARLEEVHAKTGKKVSLVGWSLGGMMARQLSGAILRATSLGQTDADASRSPRSASIWSAIASS